MKPVALFFLSFLTAVLILLQGDAVQKRILEKGALYLEQWWDVPVFFHHARGLKCTHVLVNGFHLDAAVLHWGSLQLQLDSESYLKVHASEFEGIYAGHPFDGTFSWTTNGIQASIHLLGGCVTLQGELPRVLLVSASGKWEKHPYLMTGSIQWKNQQLHIREMAFQVDQYQGSISGTCALREQLLQARIECTASAFSAHADILTAFDAHWMPLSPSIQAEVQGEGFRAEAKWNEWEEPFLALYTDVWTLKWENLQGEMAPFKIQGQFTAEGIARLAGTVQMQFFLDRIDLDGVLQGPNLEKIALSGRMPWNPVELLAIEIQAAGELSPLLKAHLSDTTLATGWAQGAVHIGGSWKDPLFSGTLSIRDGSYESLTLGCSFQEIGGSFRLEGEALLCDQIVGRDSLGGTISGRGQLALTPGFPFDFTLEASHLELLHLEYAKSTASGSIHFKGDAAQGAFQGQLHVDEVDIQLPDVTPSRLHALEVEYVNQPQHELPPTLLTQRDGWPILLDIELALPKNVVLSGTQFHSEWSGLLQLKGSVCDPQLFGELKVLNGNFLFNGKNFQTHEGRVHFGGSFARKSTLYLIAKHKLEDIEIGVILKGPLREPELAFQSNPPKSSKEILSLILFNKPTGDMNIEERQELSRTIIKLGDQFSKGPAILDRIRSSFGIDRIDIATDEDAMSLRVGKYLTSRLFLSLKKSMTEDHPNQASLEADLTNHFKARAEVGDDAEACLTLKWENSY